MDVVSGYSPVVNQPQAELPGQMRRRLERDEQLLGGLRRGANGVDDLVSRIYGETNERLGFLARHQVVAHLNKLDEDGRGGSRVSRTNPPGSCSSARRSLNGSGEECYSSS